MWDSQLSGTKVVWECGDETENGRTGRDVLVCSYPGLHGHPDPYSIFIFFSPQVSMDIDLNPYSIAAHNMDTDKPGRGCITECGCHLIAKMPDFTEAIINSCSYAVTK